jgi:hypothetical protein
MTGRLRHRIRGNPQPGRPRDRLVVTRLHKGGLHCERGAAGFRRGFGEELVSAR